MDPNSFELSSVQNSDSHNEIRIEIQQDHEGSHNGLHTIQLQSPGGSSHFVEGLVVSTSQQLSSNDTHMSLAHGNTVIVENQVERSLHQSIQDGSITVTEAEVDGDTEKIICGSGYQVVSLTTNDNGETIFIVPKQESSGNVVLLGSGTENISSSRSLNLKQTNPPIIVRQPPNLSSTTNLVTKNNQPTLVVVSSDSQQQTKRLEANDDSQGERPKRKAAMKAIAARKAAKRKRERYAAAKQAEVDGKVHDQIGSVSKLMKSEPQELIIPDNPDIVEENGKENNDPADSPHEATDIVSMELPDIIDGGIDEFETSDDDEELQSRRCVVCLRRRRFTEDIFDSSKQLYYHIDVLIAHLNIDVKGTSANTGICPECMNNLQRWHIFNCAIVKRHEQARNTGVKVVDEPISYQSFESRVYKNYKKMAKVKEVYQCATHTQYTRRHLNEKDWDFFCDHLFHSNSVKSEKSKELEKFLTSREKLSKMYCLICEKLIPNGKKGYAKHMQTDHEQSPIMYPCDICGNTFPEKDMTASTEDYYPHWISHFYFNKCDDCGKRFPTKRALGQHRHAVHKNRQVKCDKCGKMLANKMSLDLHLLRHLPENEKKKYMIKCKICKKRIAQWNLKSHMATHNDERPWKCDHCDATFKMKGALVSHRDVVHFNLKNHVCPICGDAFKSASSLRGHVRRHEGRKDYKCEVCLKEYYTYSALKGHKVVHQTARDFICAACGKAFKKKKALEEHATIHTGEKRHRCPICGREVRVKSNLYKHMKIHKKNPTIKNTTSPQSRKKSPAKVPNDDLLPPVSGLNSTISTPQDTNENMTVTLDNGTIIGDHMTPFVVSIVTAGNEHLSSPSNIVEISGESHAQQIINAVVQASGQQNRTPVSISHGGTTTYLTPHFQPTGSNQSNIVQALTMQHQHQDLLNVPLQGYYTTTPQYFNTLDQLQN